MNLGVPRPTAASPSLPPCHTAFLPVPLLCPLRRTVSGLGLGPTLTQEDLLFTDHVCRDPISDKVSLTGSGVDVFGGRSPTRYQVGTARMLTSSRSQDRYALYCRAGWVRGAGVMSVARSRFLTCTLYLSQKLCHSNMCFRGQNAVSRALLIPLILPRGDFQNFLPRLLLCGPSPRWKISKGPLTRFPDPFSRRPRDRGTEANRFVSREFGGT